MAKSLFDRFYDDYYSKEVRGSKSYPVAFEKANERFQDEHLFPAYNSYETFRARIRNKKAGGKT